MGKGWGERGASQCFIRMRSATSCFDTHCAHCIKEGLRIEECLRRQRLNVHSLIRKLRSREGVVVVVAPIRGGEEEGARRRRELVRGTGLT